MDYSPKQDKNLSAEQVILFAGIFGFIVFIWMMAFLFFPLLGNKPITVVLSPMIVEMAATRGFVLPPTWTPSPTREIIPTSTATQIVDGSLPTRIYTPRPTSLPGLPAPIQIPKLTVIDLARIMQGESPGDKEAAYRVGWVAKNRLLHPGYGDTYAVVSNGFFGYRADLNPSKEFLEIARRIIKSREDPTGGCLYALSRTDITNLGIPPSRADVAYGEWFFFKTWPLGNRGR
ncbi:MAG: hypothetical protein HYR94_10745 [Chloroflexi bacterium]|nr:hypothetical protein [Chloroflexota bacterium]